MTPGSMSPEQGLVGKPLSIMALPAQGPATAVVARSLPPVAFHSSRRAALRDVIPWRHWKKWDLKNCVTDALFKLES